MAIYAPQNDFKACKIEKTESIMAQYKQITQKTVKNYTLIILKDESSLYPYTMQLNDNISGLSQFPIQYEDKTIAYDRVPPKYAKNLTRFMAEVVNVLFHLDVCEGSIQREHLFKIWRVDYRVKKFIRDNNLV